MTLALIRLLPGRVLACWDSGRWRDGHRIADASKFALLPGPALIGGRGSFVALRAALAGAAVDALDGDALLASLSGVAADALSDASPTTAAHGLELLGSAYSPRRGRWAATVREADGGTHELVPGELRCAPMPVRWRLADRPPLPLPETLPALAAFACRMHLDLRADAGAPGSAGTLWLAELSADGARIVRGPDLDDLDLDATTSTPTPAGVESAPTAKEATHA